MSFEAATALAGALPLATGYAVADALSRVHHAVAPHRRAAVRANLRALLGEDRPVDAFEREVFRSYGRFVLEFLRGPDVPELDVRFDGWSVLESARAPGRGVILATMHTGNWELVGARMAERGTTVHAVASTQLHRSWEPRLHDRQQRAGIHVLRPGFAGTRRILELLAANAAVVLLVDGISYRGTTPVSFGAGVARWPTGPARLAARTGAPLVPAFERREADGSLRCEFLPAIPVTGVTPAEILSATRRLAAVFDERLRAVPGQWMLFRPFFERDVERKAFSAEAAAARPRTEP